MKTLSNHDQDNMILNFQDRLQVSLLNICHCWIKKKTNSLPLIQILALFRRLEKSYFLTPLSYESLQTSPHQ